MPTPTRALIAATLVLLGACASAPTRSVSEIVAPSLAAHRAHTDSLLVAATAGRNTAAIPPDAPRAVLDSTMREYALRHLDTASAAGLLRGMFSESRLQFAVLGHQSTVLLGGPSGDVANALSALAFADQPPGHVLIEAVVIQFSRETLRQFALSLDQATKGTVSDAAVQLGSLVNPAIVFTSLLGAGNTQGFRAGIDALESEQLARVIARPYLSARSGDSASITVGRDRYIVTTAFNGQANMGSQQVSTGVLLSLMPVAMPDSQVRLQISVEQSEFIPTEGDEALQVDRSTAKTMMQVRSGQTIVIGGLSVERDTRYDAGLPFFRRLWPFAWTNSRGSDRLRQDVVILVTPYLWHPGSTLPAGITPPR